MLKDQLQKLTAQDEAVMEKRPPRPIWAFLLSLTSGTLMVSFSSGIASYTQYYFITTVFAQNSFIIGFLTVFTGALLYQKPKEHNLWSLIVMSLGIDELVLVTSISSTIPILQISPLGPAAGVIALLSGFLGLLFKPELARATARN